MEIEISPNRVPIECYWDNTDSRLLAIETEYLKDLNRAFDGHEPS